MSMGVCFVWCCAIVLVQSSMKKTVLLYFERIVVYIPGRKVTGGDCIQLFHYSHSPLVYRLCL